eukprot:TRINITY_DN8688_c0_g1_i1.p1 TRINITY_DN8688_c0_g1~~TRINITY_DN8688_c0_g1_i1.p1  ORF type:complete len:306 (+),score=122.04 TRINITY_DN8688_c0_g1_i1:129-1046(+)
MASTGPAADNLMTVISRMLQDFVQANDRVLADRDLDHSSYPVQCFEALTIPPISIAAYMARIEKYAGCSKECYVMGLMLIDRLIQRNPSVHLSSHNVHRLVVIAVMVAAKMRDDIYYSNKFYSGVAGVSVKEINYLEAEFLSHIDWNLHISHDDYCLYLEEINSRYGPLTGPTGQQLAAWLDAEDHSEDLEEEDSVSEDAPARPDSRFVTQPVAAPSVLHTGGDVAMVDDSEADEHDTEMSEEDFQYCGFNQFQQAVVSANCKMAALQAQRQAGHVAAYYDACKQVPGAYYGYYQGVPYQHVARS